MADRVGKKRATVANSLRLLKLPAKVQHDIKVGLLSAGHAKAILGVEDPETQEQLCDLTIHDGLSVRQLETLVRKMQINPNLKPVTAPHGGADLPENYRRLAGCFGKFCSNDISMRRSSSGKGTVTLRFNSDAEVDAFLKVLEEKLVG